MTPALVFILAATGLTLLVVAVLCVALWRGALAGARANRGGTPADQQDLPTQANAAVYRDQLLDLEREHALGRLSDEELQVGRDELTQRLLEDVGPVPVMPADNTGVDGMASSHETRLRKPWWLMLSVIFCVPVLSMGMYSVLGEPQALDPLAAQQGMGNEGDVTPEKLVAMATALTRRLQDEPNQVDGWVMLGRVQRALGRYGEADEALRRALALSQDDNVWIERAEVLAQKNGGNFAGEPWAIIQRVLTADPHQLNALLLAGSASYAEDNFRSALRFWERAREEVSPDSPDAPELDRAIAEARSKLGLPPALPRADSVSERDAAIQASSISGRVSLVSELAGKVAPTDTVFVYATPVTGSRMPLAIVRTTAAKLPFDFVLDDSTAMNPAAKLSDAQEVTVRVRISKSGQATQQAGDLGVSVSPVKPGSTGLNLMVRDALR
ncbi:c-type cytochrome biogenesis protein CcmI [Limnohabitans sp.]|uniref:c-type cytochrome biogenesis protein CcmI n=1 Tax=Limnohabitans sp. TaxID=1907725 RepID=UPI0038B8F6F3